MEKIVQIFVSRFFLFLLDLCQKMRYFSVLFSLFYVVLVVRISYLCNITNRNRLWIILIKVNAEVENLAQDKCQQILHDRREALANKVRRRA